MVVKARSRSVLAFKSVQQSHTPDEKLLHLLDEFRLMVNYCIKIGLTENVTSLKALSLKAYRQLSEYDSMSYYKVCAISAAAGILRNYRKAKHKNPSTKQPYARKLRLSTCYGFKIQEGTLLLPSNERNQRESRLRHMFKIRLGAARFVP